jgi:hypothetical protein
MIDGILSEAEHNETARSLFTACLMDFLFHLMARPEPMIVGSNYPRDKLVREFERWAGLRNLNTSNCDMELWNNLWKSKLLL